MSRILGAKIIPKPLTRVALRNGTVRLGLAGPVLRPGAYVQARWISVSARNYAQPPGGGGGFPGFSLGPQHQKGEALKEYVRHLPIYYLLLIWLTPGLWSSPEC
jgi:ATP-dependent Clp protease ATP-binding subunit ClpB